MKTTLVLLALLIITSIAFAQAPDWVWAVNAGSTQHDFGRGLATDLAGNSYTCGNFRGTATFGAFQLTSTGENDVFIAKLDTNGNYLWAKKAGGTNDDQGFGIDIDSNGNCYATGYFTGNVTFGGTQLSGYGDKDMFVCKLNSNGDFLWAVKGGGSWQDSGWDIAVDNSGNSYVSGLFTEVGTFGSFIVNGGSIWSSSSYVAKISTTGTFLWLSNGVGATDRFVWGYGVAVDANGNSLHTGKFDGPTCTFGSIVLTNSTASDCGFIAKLDSAGNWLWVQKIDTNDRAYPMRVDFDSFGNCYGSGYFKTDVQFGSYAFTSNGIHDAYIAKLDPNGNWLWARTVGSTGTDESYGLTVDANNNVLMSCIFNGTVMFGPHQLTSLNPDFYFDIALAKLDVNGNFIWVKQAGGLNAEVGSSMGVDGDGDIYLTGFFNSDGYPANFDSHQISTYGLNDIFVAKLSGEGAANIAPQFVNTPVSPVNLTVGDAPWTFAVTVIPPETVQITDAVVVHGMLAGMSFVITPGYTCTIDFTVTPQVSNIGTHLITITATDNGSPNLSTEFQFQIIIQDLPTGFTYEINSYDLAWYTGNGYVFPTNQPAFLDANDLVSEILFNGDSFSPQAYTPYIFGATGNHPFVAGIYSVLKPGYISWLPDSVEFVSITTDYETDFLGIPEDQTPVELSSFTAVLTASNYVQLTWVSQTETNMLGYRVYRNDSENQAGSVMITPILIPASNSSTQQSYTVTDPEVEIGQTYYYWLESVDVASSQYFGPLSINVEGDVPPVTPELTSMKNAYPNPFKANDSTTIEVALKGGETGTVTVYNLLGQVVRSFTVSEGTHTINWNGKDSNGAACSSGIYFYKLSTPSINHTKKMVIIK